MDETTSRVDDGDATDVVSCQHKPNSQEQPKPQKQQEDCSSKF